MPRNGSGVYSKPAGTTAVPNTTIESAKYNSTIDDIAADLNLARPVVSGGTGATTAADARTNLGLAIGTDIPSILANRGLLYGLTLSNNATDATNDIDIAAGTAASDSTTAPVAMTITSALTKRLDAAWAVGSGNGGLDTGSIANTTYHVWLIQRSDTGVVDALFSASATAPTMPANYDRKRRIGSIIRTSGAIVAFIQNGDLFLRTGAFPTATFDPVGTTGAFNVSVGVPSGIKVTAKLRGALQNTSSVTNSAILLSSPEEFLVTPTYLSGYVTAVSQVVNVYTAFTVDISTNISAQVRAICADTTSSFYISTYGWIDTRGRLA